MYDIIPAQERHLDQIVPLLVTTGYWDAGLKDNLHELPPRDFMRQFVAVPNLPLTWVLIRKGDVANTVLGVIVCGSKEKISQVPDHSPFMSPRVAALFAPFGAHQMSESYHISFLAVSRHHRRQGLGRMLMQFAESRAKEEGLDTLSLYTFSCLTSAVKLYNRMGMMPVDAFSVLPPLPWRLVLYFEKNEQIQRAHDYFETLEYNGLAL